MLKLLHKSDAASIDHYHIKMVVYSIYLGGENPLSLLCQWEKGPNQCTGGNLFKETLSKLSQVALTFVTQDAFSHTKA